MVDSDKRKRNTAANSGFKKWRLTFNLKVSALYYLCRMGQFRSGNSATDSKLPRW